MAFGAHPDDIEFGCGGVIVRETKRAGRRTSSFAARGEAGTNGSPAERTLEAEKAAALLGRTVEFIELDGDAHLEVRAAHAIKLAAIVRRYDRALCWRRASWKTSIQTTAGLDNWCATLHGWRRMAA